MGNVIDDTILNDICGWNQRFLFLLTLDGFFELVIWILHIIFLKFIFIHFINWLIVFRVEASVQSLEFLWGIQPISGVKCWYLLDFFAFEFVIQINLEKKSSKTLFIAEMVLQNIQYWQLKRHGPVFLVLNNGRPRYEIRKIYLQLQDFSLLRGHHFEETFRIIWVKLVRNFSSLNRLI